MKVRSALLLAALASGLLSCGPGDTARHYPITGQVISVQADRQEITLKHDDIEGYMPGMVMAFKVRDRSLINDRGPGDLVKGTLVVLEDDAYLETLDRVGFEALSSASQAAAVSASVEPIAPGAEVVDRAFVDQDGHPWSVTEERGKALACTFIYTRCPLPTFCPRMDRNFAEVQRLVKADTRLEGRVRLVSVSFDPAFDTSPVLKDHATSLGADPTIWSFVTAEREAVEVFGAQFGVAVMREPDSPIITHNLRTVVIDPAGRLVIVLPGNEWTPEQVISHLRDALDLPN